jgi:hypothetical protein
LFENKKINAQGARHKKKSKAKFQNPKDKVQEGKHKKQNPTANKTRHKVQGGKPNCEW